MHDTAAFFSHACQRMGRRGLKIYPAEGRRAGRPMGFSGSGRVCWTLKKKKFDLITGSLGFVQYFYLAIGFLI
jgi:hypothetical protein